MRGKQKDVIRTGTKKEKGESFKDTAGGEKAEGREPGGGTVGEAAAAGLKGSRRKQEYEELNLRAAGTKE